MFCKCYKIRAEWDEEPPKQVKFNVVSLFCTCMAIMGWLFCNFNIKDRSCIVHTVLYFDGSVFLNK